MEIDESNLFSPIVAVFLEWDRSRLQTLGTIIMEADCESRGEKEKTLV
jgi:hypothetical protein